ncbi:MAG: response regulator, partial [Ramlibacter sp.]|nr:response regulator [Ramlibacter sp.]
MPNAASKAITASPAQDTTAFQRILKRNVTLPLGVGLFGALLFVVLVAYLLSTIGWVEHTDQILRRANILQKLTIDKETGMRGFLLTGDEAFLAPYEIAKPRLKTEGEALKLAVADNPVQLDRLRRIDGLQEEWDKFGAMVVDARRKGGNYLEAIRAGRGKRLTDEIRSEFDDFVDTEQRLRLERNNTASRTSWVVIATYLIFTLLISGFLAFNGRRELVSLSRSYGAALDEQQRHAESLAAQAWLRDGQRQLGDSLEGKQDLARLGHNALEFLSNYLGSVVGALYVRSDSGHLQRVAGWGFSTTDDTAGTAFAQTDSLVAEAANNARQIQLRDLPSSYLRVTSGLGQGAPTSVIISPVMNDGVVNGVIELGFMRALEDRDGELLEFARASVGASVEAARYRQRLQDSLEETQQLNEELQVQQEELRTSNEELEEQSRALKESQAHLESQQAELEQINVQLSDQRDALDDKNEALGQAQREVEARASELERASQYKSEFLANMSHELRTPLNSTLILARLLADNGKGNLDAEQVKFSESIYSAGNDLLNLINDILDIAKVEAGKMDVRAETTSVNAMAEALKRTFEPLAANKKLSFELIVGQQVPATLYTDRQRVEQILKNLLSNAVKFTDKGNVTLEVQPHGASEVAFRVTDSGIGVDAGQQKLIFEAFRQADGTTSRKYGGTGLGLSISRDLARLLGGKIDVSSKPGVGSTFTLTLPMQYEEAEQPAPQPPHVDPASLPSLASPAAPPRRPRERAAPIPDDRDIAPVLGQRRVLVVEDEPQFAQILRDLAHELGYGCIVAQQADGVLELAERLRPDAMLLDMRLPDGSGLSVLQRLKDNATTRHIPVHVISVQDLSETALQMGAIGYARKPTTRDELRAVFSRLEAKLSQKVKRVLVVEDDKLQRESIARLIGDEDIEIVTVESGMEALDRLHREIFDCMIIDLKLPDMTGNEVLKRMAGEEIRSFPPVIVYTGRNLTREEEAELQRSSRSIIIKGARSPERLLDEVTLFLHKV